MRKKSELPQLEHLISDGVLPHVSHDWRIRPVIGVASATRVILRSVSSDSWGVLQSLHCLNCCLCIYIGGGGRGIIIQETNLSKPASISAESYLSYGRQT